MAKPAQEPKESSYTITGSQGRCLEFLVLIFYEEIRCVCDIFNKNCQWNSLCVKKKLNDVSSMFIKGLYQTHDIINPCVKVS